MKTLAAAGVLLATGSPALADDFQLWTSYAVTAKIDDKWQVAGDLGLRVSNDATHLGHVQPRLLVSRKISDKARFGIGYTFVRDHDPGQDHEYEHRIFEQLNYDLLKSDDVNIKSRTRLEHRFLPGQSGISNRLRQQIRFEVPFGPETDSQFVTHYELFVLLNDLGSNVDAGVNRLRSFVGFKLPLTKAISVEPGYMNQANFQGDTRTDHILNVSLSASF